MATVTGTRRLLDISGNNISTAVSLEAEGTLLDVNGAAGTSGQVLSSIGSGVDWVDASSVIGGPYLPLAGGTMTGNLNLTYAYPRINLTDTNNDSDYSIINNNGIFGIYDVTNNSYRLSISAAGNATFAGDVIADGSIQILDSAANLTISGDTSGNAYYNNSVGTHRFRAEGSSVNSMEVASTFITLNEPVTATTTLTATGKITANGGIDGLTLANGGINGANYDIRGVNQLVISDPGEGIVFTGTATMYLNAVDDATDSILKLTNATQLNLNSTARITSLVDPSGAQDAATKNYVDTEIGNIPSGLAFEGNWNASTDTPALAGTTQDNGKFWIVSVAGSTNLSGITDWAVGDWAIYVDNGAGTDAWQKVDNSSSLAGAGSAGKVTFWSSTSNVSFNNNFTYDGTNLTAPRMRVGDGTDGFFYSDTAGRTAFAAGDFYIQSSVPNYFNYATNIYLGDTTGDNVLFRGSTITGTSWGITPAGLITAASGFTTYVGKGYSIGSSRIVYYDGTTYLGNIDNQGSGSTVIRSAGNNTLTLDTSNNATFAGDLTVSGGDITLGGISGRVSGVVTVLSGSDATSKTYVDSAISTAGGAFLPKAGGVMSGKIGRSSAIVGFLEGSYNNVGANGSNSNPIYTIGSSYNPASTTLGNMYGVGYTSDSASFITLTGTTDWGFYVAADGDARVFLDGTSGNISHAGDLYVGGGDIILSGTGRIQGVDTVSASTDAANKAYVDAHGGGLGPFLPLAGGTMANTNLVTNMNADLLDGISSASFLRSDAVDTSTQRINFNANNTNNWDTIATASGSQGGIEIYNSGVGNDAFMAFHAGNDFAFYFGIDADNNQLSVGGWSMGANKYKVWNESNDGAGSGLDADLLDGLQATSFLRSDAADTSTGEILFDAGFKSDSILLSGAQNFDNISRSGFYNLYNTSTGSTNSPPLTYGTMIVVGGNKQNSSFGLQIAHERTGAGMYVRGMNDSGSTWYDWDEIWNSGNDGAGSGLDADLLDGQQGSYYVNTSTTQSIAGAKTFTTTPISVTRSTADNSTYLATTAFVKNQGYITGSYLPLAGGTMTGPLVNRRININRSSGAGGQLWYSSSYTSWQNYMNPGGAGAGYGANITAPTGTYVTSWALRSFIENASGYGWTWEGGSSSSTTPSIVAELSSSTGNFKTIGNIYASGGNSTQWNTHTSNTGTISSINATTNGGALSTSNTLTGNGTLTLAWQGNTASYVRGDGSLATFPTIPQGDVTGITVSNGITGSSLTGPVPAISMSGTYAGNFNFSTNNVVVGGTFANNAYSSTTGARLMFGGGNSDAIGNYYIGTNLENFGGNYNKLDLRWHTGIRMGAQSQYGGVRIFDSEDLGTVLFSVGSSGTGVVVSNTLTVTGGNIVLGGISGRIQGVVSVLSGTDATSKTYVDGAISTAGNAFLPKANPTFTGTLTGPAATITTVTGALAGNASTSTTFSTGRTNYKGATDGAVAGQLMWKEYGNNHTIFDASDSTSPSGGSVNNTNPSVTWTGTYPTLMGWNGSSTYGVRVDISRYAEQLKTARTIAGVSFNGTANISLNNNAITNGAGYTTNTGTVTSVATGSGLTGGTITTTGTVSVDYGTAGLIADAPGGSGSPDIDDLVLIGLDSSSSGETRSFTLSDLPFTNNTGDITAVTAGTGMTGGGTSGSVTLNVIGGTGITANANDIAVDSTVLRTSGNQTRTGNLQINGAVTFPTSSGGTLARGQSYAIYQESGSWTYPYPDLCIGFHTGISMGANASYNGMRFFNDNNLTTQVMSINNGSDGLGANNVYINNGLRVNGGTLVLGNTGVGDMYLGNYSTANYFRFHTNNSNTYFDMNCGNIYWRQGTGTRYTFFPSTANMTVNGTITQLSDIRNKENVVEIGDCISKVQAMRGVYYNRTDINTEVTKVGVIAQEVEAVLPELILESPEDGFKSVAYAELTAVLINAIKEQQEIIENLTTRIEQLEN